MSALSEEQRRSQYLADVAQEKMKDVECGAMDMTYLSEMA